MRHVFHLNAYIGIDSPFGEPIEEPPAMAGIIFLEVYRHSNTDMFPKKSIPAAVAVNLAEEMGKLSPNSSPSFAAILQLALQREYRDSTGKIAIRSHIS
ncbi:hypothetical protein V6N13_064126 [Hibiscus sabdariffa]